MNKYKFTEETKNLGGRTLHQIVAVTEFGYMVELIKIHLSN
jgi:hypothetical protein